MRGGIYDRVQLRQGLDTFTFRDLDYLNLYGLEAAGAPRFTESAIFIVRSGAFSAAYPWKLAMLGNRVDRAPARAASPASRRATGCPRGRWKAAARSSRNRRRPG